MVHVPVKVVFFYRFAMFKLLLLDAARAPRALAYLEIRSRNEEAIYLQRSFTSYVIDVKHSSGYLLFICF